MVWNVYNEGGPGNYNLRFVNYKWNRSLDYPASSGGANHWQYGVYDLVHSPGQRFWRFWRSDTSTYEISVELGGHLNVMDAFAAHSGNGNPVGNERITRHPRQRWHFVWV
jgi:hypothetical protein